MGTRNTQITATGTGRNNTGSGHFAETGSVLVGNGGALTTKGVDLAGATIGGSGGVTIGETGLGPLFADTLKQITESNTSGLLAALHGNGNAAIPNPTADLTATDPATTAASITQSKWFWPGLAVVAGLAYWLWKRS